MVISNVSIYRTIAEEAYIKMVNGVENQRTPKQNGTGWIIKYDPGHMSFKNAMIVVVFTGMWLEALLHIRIVQKYDEKKFKQYDFKSYKDKLRLLGVEDEELLEKVERFRKIRKELVHEKAFLDDGTIKTAQEEAKIAYEIMKDVRAKCLSS